MVGAANPKKVAWGIDHGLMLEQLRTKNAALAKEGLRPATLTAIPWDGAVRYCAIWVKDEAPAKSP